MANKKLYVTGAVVVAAAIAFLAVRNPWLQSPGTEGTIGAANRYQSEQITSHDVTLDTPEIAAFIQTDTFRKIAADPALREAFRSEALNRVIAAEGLRGKTAELAAFVGTDAGRALVGSEQVRAALDAGVFKNVEVGALARAQADAARWVDANARARHESMRGEALRSFYDDAATVRSIDALRRLATDKGVVTEPAIQSLLADGFTGRAAEAGALALLALDQSRLTAAMDALRAPELGAAARVEGLQSVMDGVAGNARVVDALSSVMRDQALVSALRNPAVLDAARMPEFARLAEGNRLSEALTAKADE